MVAINAHFLLLAAIYVVAAVALLVYPTSYSLYGYDVSLLSKYLASDVNTWVVIPRWAGLLVALSSIVFYATTFPSQHDKAKVARGVLFALIGVTQSAVQDQYYAKQSVFSSLQSKGDATAAYVRIGAAALLTVWCFVECFSATEDDAQPIKAGAKKNKHASTGSPANNVYLRVLSLVWLIEGVLIWFSPSHLSWFGFPANLYSTSLLSHFSTAIIGSLFVALSTIAGYGATFQSVHDQAKLARSFLLYWAMCVGYTVYGKSVLNVKTGMDDRFLYGHLAASIVFALWSLVASFSATSDDIRNPAVKTTIKKKE